MSNSTQLPLEVELAIELMPCQALRQTYDATESPHPCAYFGEWGHYHSYDYAKDGPPAQPSVQLPVVYAGKRQVVPEMLSGCRKAPILCVGINPNLPGWFPNAYSAIHPYFDDVLQYAHYFRYRTRDKKRIPLDEYEARLGTAPDGPAVTRPLVAPETEIPSEPAPVLMYQQYQRLLDGLAQKKLWQGHKLSVGEDIAYANMVGCPSAKWVVSPNAENPDMPVMGRPRAKGIVQECFVKRRYFLRQLLQSLPAVILVFSKTTAEEFITALQPRFSKGTPQAHESLPDLFQREIRLLYGTLNDGTVLDARVIFMPHASSKPEEFQTMLAPCIDLLAEEVDNNNLIYNPSTGHLNRGRGACVFCDNALYKIGKCDYAAELKPLTAGNIEPLAAAPREDALADKREQLRLLKEFTDPAPAVASAQILADEPAPPPLVLRGKIVTMAGDPIENGAIYIKDGRIVAVQAADAEAPEGFDHSPIVDTGGIIYPGLLDLHNHLPYNILPLWKPPRRYDNRNTWRASAQYRRDITGPMSLIAKSGQNAIKAIIRYIEVKLLVGGVTSGQGMISLFKGNQYYRGLCRNFEAPDDPALPRAGTRLPDLKIGDVPAIKASLDNGNPYYFHLAEGLDTKARQQYLLLKENQLLRPNLICIHSLALTPAQHQSLASAGAKVVWSPLSNSLLYGETINPKVLKDASTLFGIGSDWTPSGSRNILQELKVAWLCSKENGGIFDFKDLVQAATIQSAQAAAWGGHVGSIEAGKLADFVVVDPREGVDDPYENLVRATEREIRMVVVGGIPRHGDTALMTAAGLPTAQLEAIQVGGRDKSLHLHHPGSPLSNLTFAAARTRLEAAMSDLDALRNATTPLFEPLSEELGMELELDMQAEELELGPELLAEMPPLSNVALDPLTIIDDPGYFDVLEAVGHLPAFYKGENGLRGFYK